MVLKGYDMNKNPTGILKDVSNLKIESDLGNADKKMTFTYLSKSRDIRNEYYIQTETDEFVVKGVKPKDDGTQEITAVMNVEDLDGKPVPVFYVSGQSLQYCADLALEGTGWTAEAEEQLASKVRTLNVSKTDVYQLCKKIAAAFFCEIWFDTLNKIVHFVEEIGEDKGVYFMRSLNLITLNVSSDTTNFYTQIHPVGKDGVTIETVNDGVAYLQNFQYSSKVRTYYWEDANYTDPEILREDAEKKLEEMSKPSVSYSASIADLAAQYEEYSILSYGLGDKVTLIDDVTGSETKQRIKKMTEYPFEPEKNTCEISNAVLTFEEYQRRIKEAAEVVEDLTAGTGVALGSKIVIYYTEDGNGVTLDDWRTMVSHQLTKEGIISTVGNYYASYEDVTEIDKRLVENETIATQTADKFKWLVASGTSESDFTLTDRTAELVAEHINLLGLVTFSGLDGSTQGLIQDVADLAIASEETLKEWCYEGDRTYIDGGNIYAGTIKATQIDVEDLFAQDITANGTITGVTIRSIENDTVTNIYTAVTIDSGIIECNKTTPYVPSSTSWTDGLGFSVANRETDKGAILGIDSSTGEPRLRVEGNGTFIGNLSVEGTTDFQGLVSITNNATLYINGYSIVERLDASYAQAVVKNSLQEGRLVVESGGTFGLNSVTHNKWLVSCDTSGNVTLNGNANTATTAKQVSTTIGDGTTAAVLRQSGGSGVMGLSIVTTNSAGTSVFHTLLSTASDGTITRQWVYPSEVVKITGGTFTGTVAAPTLQCDVLKSKSGTVNITMSDTAFKPTTSNAYSLGSANRLWSTVYAKTSTINTSDEMEKDILPRGITEAHEALFMDLEPILYRWKQFDWEGHVPDRIHCGLGARRTAELAEKHGFTMEDLAFLCRDDLEEVLPDGRTERYGIRYGELHGLEIHMIQKNYHNIATLETEISTVKAQQSSYEDRLNYVSQQLQEVLSREAQLISENTQMREKINNLRSQLQAQA